ncbi:hypothetical protein ACQ4PT_039160 [Festuca glaucescens]
MGSLHKITYVLVTFCLLVLGRAEYVKYKDPKQSLAVRIKDLLSRMTLAKKIGQMTQIEREVATAEAMSKYFIGSVLSGGGSLPALQASAEAWASMLTEMQKGALSTCLGIPMIYGIDAVDGHNSVYRATIFPHNIGLGATRDPMLVKRIGETTALEVRATGISYVFAPCIAVMVPFAYTEFIDELTSQVKKNIIPMSRIDDAVYRILRVKFTMGLFENPFADPSLASELGKQEHRELAREAVRKSLVLLKNGKSSYAPLLPLPKKANKILVAGSHADNLGNQCGGWTITWQGEPGNNNTAGTTILSAINSTVDPNTQVVYAENPDSSAVEAGNYDYAIVVVGEPPYAESAGDNLNLTIPEPGRAVIQTVCKSIKCMVILISGRPLVVEPYIGAIDAFVAAWLPGSEGQGVADVLFGDYGFTGKLPRTWFRTVDQLPMNVGDEHYDPLFPFGFGLTTEARESVG